MDTETEKKIEETVLKILRNSDTMDKVTRDIIKKSSPEKLWMNLSAPSENLGMKLSAPVYKEIVRQVVETYLTERKSNTEMKNVEETVVKILRNSDVMDKVTEYIIWKSASENLVMNLSAAVYKEFVRQVVETYLTGDQSNTAAEAQQKEDEVEKQVEEEEDEEGGLIIARLSRMRKVTIAEFGGKPLVSIYEYSKWPGKEIPTSNGVSLTSEEWETCSKNVPATEKAIRKMESRLARLDDLYKEMDKYGAEHTDMSKRPRETDKDGADDSDDPYEEIVISKKKRITVRSWLWKVVVDIREFCVKNGKQRPCKTGISLTLNQWNLLREHVDEIDKAVAQWNLLRERVDEIDEAVAINQLNLGA